MSMRVLIAGAGIGGLTAALSLHEAGIEVEVFEQARELSELGVGLNLLPHATKELAALGLLPQLDRVAIRTRETIYATRFGQPVWRELRGMFAGYDVPQFSIHRGKLHGVLVQAALERLGPARVHTGCPLTGFSGGDDHVVARFQRRDGQDAFDVRGDALVGCDGIHSTVRSLLYPDEGPPIWSGLRLWRGVTDWPVVADGRTVIIAGGIEAKFVFYPLGPDASAGRVLTNWGVMARVGAFGDPTPERGDWNRPGDVGEAVRFARDRFRFDFVDPVALIEATERIYEYPNCDREPLPRWSFGRTTLLGDAAHPMWPAGANGASQAILDARALARHLSSGLPVVDALAAYDTERRPVTAEVVMSNRLGGSERVIDLVETRAPDGFDDIEAVASYAEREAIARGYATLAGYSTEQVNRR
jgi:2-polyprenyl-6-methoxyphenol hydroxylase-like FAD-dependent oxidoreductase